MFRRDNLPKLLGSDWLTKRVLRFAWHLTTIAWWGFAVILYLLSTPSDNLRTEILITIAVIFALSGVVSLLFSRGKHLSWLFFFGIALTSILGM
jgi:Cu/Ag efflux pump CusA